MNNSPENLLPAFELRDARGAAQNAATDGGEQSF